MEVLEKMKIRVGKIILNYLRTSVYNVWLRVAK